MKKVIRSKRAGLSLLVTAMIFIELFMAGCGKKEAVKVADNMPTIEAPAETPAPTATPEPTIDPEIARQAEEARIEEAALAYYNKVSAIPGYPYSYEEVLTMVNVFNGYYDQSRLGTQSDIDKYVREIKMYPMAFVNTLLFNDEKKESSNININPEIYRIFLDSAVGKYTLKDVDELGAKVYSSRRNDREAFKANASLFLSLVEKIYFSQISSETNWNGTPIPYPDEMNIHVEDILRYHIIGYLTTILNDKDGKNLTASDNECITAQILLKNLVGGINCNDVSMYEQNSSLRLANELKGAKDKALALTPNPS